MIVLGYSELNLATWTVLKYCINYPVSVANGILAINIQVFIDPL